MSVRIVWESCTSLLLARELDSSRKVRITSTRSFGRMKPPAELVPRLSVTMATARMPGGRIAAMNPLSGRTSFCARIGSPVRKPERTDAPTVSSRALGLILRVM